MTKCKIVDIPTKMEKFYGKGKMLHPSIEEIEELVKTIPKGFVATIDALAKRLAKDFGTDVTCPMRTGNAIKKISERYSNDNIDLKTPFWRVIRSDKMIIKSKNFEFCASKIEDEGFKLLFTKSGAIKLDVNGNRMFFF
ncbi:MGMT family protein [uncultured Maribacter sp.]|uniref:MGMT family protein n=1 Tax=uncultured Maribacter sp. TaxID=431308 RepID=UPI00262BEC41|nr:MGMT family protein [uncultured Maribacter sp.]